MTSLSDTHTTRLESTLISVLVQARNRGIPYARMAPYIDRLRFDTSRKLADALFERPGHDPEYVTEARTLRTWAAS